MAIFEGPNGQPFAIPDVYGAPPQDLAPDMYGMTPYDAGAYAPPAQEANQPFDTGFYGLPPSVLERIAPGVAAPQTPAPPKPQPDVPLGAVDTAGVVPYQARSVTDVVNAEPRKAAPQIANPDDFGTAYNMSAQAIEKSRDAQNQLAGLDIQKAEEVQAAERAGMERVQAEQAKVQAARDEYVQRLADGNREVREQVDRWANSKVDRSRLWADKGTGSKILSALGVAMSAMGDILNKRQGPNLALQVIMSAIDKDVEDQTREREFKKDQIGQLRSSWDDYRKNGASEIEAKQMRVAEEIERVKLKSREIAASYGTPEALARQKQLEAGLDQQQAALLGQAAEGRAHRGQQAAQLKLAQSQGALGWANRADRKAEHADEMAYRREKDAATLELARIEAEGKKRAAAADTDGAIGGFVKLDKDGLPVYDVHRQPDGSVWKPEKGLYKEVVERKTSTQSSINWLARAKEIRELTGGAGKFEPTDQAEFDQAMANAVIEFAKANGLSTSDQQSIEFARNALFGGDPSSYTVSDVGGRIDRAIGAAEGKFTEYARNAGYLGKQNIKFHHPEIKNAPKPTYVDELVEGAQGRSKGEKLYGSDILTGPSSDYSGIREENIDKLAGIAGSGVAETSQQDKAWAALEEMSKTHPDSGARKYAAKKLTQIAGQYWQRRNSRGAVTKPSQSPPANGQ